MRSTRLHFTPRVFVRAIIAFLIIAIAALIGLSFLPTPILRQLFFLWISQPPDPTPPPPTILAPRGALPTTTVGLQEWALHEGGQYSSVGSGFLLKLDDGRIVGVTTSHSVGDIGDPANALQWIAFDVAGRDGFITESDTLFGAPGAPREGDDMSVDYVLLTVSGEIDQSLALAPDARGGPQPGERVSLHPL